MRSISEEHRQSPYFSFATISFRLKMGRVDPFRLLPIFLKNNIHHCRFLLPPAPLNILLRFFCLELGSSLVMFSISDLFSRGQEPLPSPSPLLFPLSLPSGIVAQGRAPRLPEPEPFAS